MQVYDTFDQFWHEYFANNSYQHGYDCWVIAKFTHTSDDEYQRLKSIGKDTLGYQPTMLTLADPVQQRSVEIVLKNLSTQSAESLRKQYSDRFITQLPKRFGLFQPDKKQADAIYKSWEQFSHEWFEKDGQNLLSYNLPLLFDHVSNAAYWGWQQKGFDPCGTQRLIVTVFQYRAGRFADIFVTNVADTELERIRLLTQSRLTLQAESLF